MCSTTPVQSRLAFILFLLASLFSHTVYSESSLSPPILSSLSPILPQLRTFFLPSFCFFFSLLSSHFLLSSFSLSPFTPFLSSLRITSSPHLWSCHLILLSSRTFSSHLTALLPVLLSSLFSAPLLSSPLSLLLSSLLTSPHFTVTCCHKSIQAAALEARANENRQGNRLIYESCGINITACPCLHLEGFFCVRVCERCVSLPKVF